MNCEMDSYWCLVLLLPFFIFQLKVVDSQLISSTQRTPDFRLYNDVLATIFQDCNYSLRNIMIFDNASVSTAAGVVSNLRVPIGIKLKSLMEIDGLYPINQIDPIEIQGLIAIINHENDWLILRENIPVYWELTNECSIFLVLRVPGACQYSSNVLQSMAIYHFPKTFYICMHEKFVQPTIYTHDPYGDTEPSNWLRIQQREISLCTWTLYRRVYNGAVTCEGFIFNRTAFSKDTRVMIAVSQEISAGNELIYVYAGDPHNLDQIHAVNNIVNLERILNMNFTYRVQFHMIKSDTNERNYVTIATTPVNVILDDGVYGSRRRFLVSSYPSFYDNYWTILSKDRGPATPLQKITNFYGIWTLISLIVILILTFITIWYKTNGRTAFAFFDILRLLINSGIVTPIDTLPLKVFFLMIFLYFTVIHATFSGNLSRFLTIPEYLKNIDSLEDLADSQVEVINSYIFTLTDEEDRTKSIAKKFVYHSSQTACWKAMMNKTNDVCIGPYWPFQRTIINQNMTGYYLSEKKIFSLPTHITYRQRFPLIEKFNWALMALSETRIYHREAYFANELVFLKAKRRSETKRQDFRPIAINDLKFAFVLLIIGNSISLLLFFCELYVARYRKTGGKRKDLRPICRIKNKSENIKIRRIQVQPRMAWK